MISRLPTGDFEQPPDDVRRLFRGAIELLAGQASATPSASGLTRDANLFWLWYRLVFMKAENGSMSALVC